MDTFLQDLRYAARTLRKSPAFTAIAVLCLSLGIATNTTLFSCLNAMVLRPFPFADPDRLVSLAERDPKRGYRNSISYLDYVDWRDQARSFAGIAGYSGRSVAITEGEEPERLSGELVTSNLFPMLGLRPQIGRLFLPDEDRAGAPGAVLLSDAVWKRRYASDSSVVGRVISINNLPHTVVGVMPAHFAFPQASEIWLPMAPLVQRDSRSDRYIQMIARLAPGVSIEQADREVAALSTRLDKQYGVVDNAAVGTARPLADEFLPEDIKLIVLTMMGAVTFVLLIACANVANLMLARAAARERELAVRAAIGAGRARIVRQLLTESAIVALLAGLIAVPLTWEGLHLLDRAIPPENPMPYYMQWSLDMPTLLYTGAIALLAGVLFGLAPALQSSRIPLAGALRDGARGASGGVKSNRLRSVLVVAEVGLSLVLLVGASLFVRTFVGLQHKRLGFDPSHILTMRFYLPGTRYDSTSNKVHATDDVLRRVQSLPGVVAATISNAIPTDQGGSGDGVIIEGEDVAKGKEPYLGWTGVAGHWFATFDVPIESGRDFTDAEVRDSSRVAVIDRTMAQKFWPRGDALGHRFRLAHDSAKTWFSVIGVSADMQMNSLGGPGIQSPRAYLPYPYLPARNHGLMVRVAGSPTSVANSVRSAIRASDPAIPVFGLRTMEKVRDLSFWQYGLFGAMFGMFGALALFLAAIGVYGVIAYGVSQRTREIGVRVALGAQRRDVLGLVVRQGMSLAGIGIAVGLAGSFVVTRVVRSLLIDVSPTDPLSFVSVTLFLCAIAFVASVIPARRATAVDPIVALRAD